MLMPGGFEGYKTWILVEAGRIEFHNHSKVIDCLSQGLLPPAAAKLWVYARLRRERGIVHYPGLLRLKVRVSRTQTREEGILLSAFEVDP